MKRRTAKFAIDTVIVNGDLIEGATLVGGAKLVEFLTNDGTGVSY